MAKEKMNVAEEVVVEQSFFAKNWKKLSIGLGVVAVAALGYVGYKKLIAEPKQMNASIALSGSEQYMLQGQYDKALAGDGQGSIGLEATINQFGGTDAGNLAQLYAGIAYYNEGKYEQAVKALESFSDCGDNIISPAAIAALGNCYACLKQNDKAVAKLEEAAKKADNASLSPIYLIQAGEIYEFGLNNKEKALECYKKVADNYKTSMQVQSGEVDKYIERASAK